MKMTQLRIRRAVWLVDGMLIKVVPALLTSSTIIELTTTTPFFIISLVFRLVVL